ncbi:helix-turn-helix transcriptional regulator [Pseudonocardia sp. MH-G8]|uniref:ArsR/SmtB family transcription factor n=1 Tax=Pseudonocardia sp. MH-G8 TaxID=1854588 RepID=UPI000BA0A822|nr:winged helix-turn-helix domain-containing protein [Pseudonocardia sp. MH-G8]OZM82317.1 transcriptional regulator [Pseudonocardia sp. MH-G8]
MDGDPVPDRDLAPVASLIGDPSRIAILAALAEGCALPAGELARRAGVHPATATAHLRRLVEGGLVVVRTQGRHRYHELAGPRVAAAIEAIAQLAPATPARSLRADRAARTLAEARTCYDHLAGRRGVELRDRLTAVGALRMVDDRDHELTPVGRRLVADLGVGPRDLERVRRVFARVCVDWTQRRPHLAGALPAALTHRLLELGWLARGVGRSLRVVPDYDRRLDAWLGRPA